MRARKRERVCFEWRKKELVYVACRQDFFPFNKKVDLCYEKRKNTVHQNNPAFVEWMLDPLWYVSFETKELLDECVNDEG